MSRLPDAVLDDCLLDPAAPFSQDPARDFGLDRKTAQLALPELRAWLNDQQRRLWANGQDALLLVLQGPDCAGKDGVIRRVLNCFDPQGLRLHSFKQPDAGERRHDFLWRYRRRLPAPGLLGVFNRSYYEGLASDLFDGLIGAAELPARLQRVLALEAGLPAQRLHPLKCYLQISRGEQQARLLQRLQRPDKRWKLRPSDLLAYREYAQRQQRWSELLTASHSQSAPWYVIPAEHRWLRDWLLASLLAREFERLQLEWPERPPPFTADDLLGAD
jgi:polyphosphate kinase 2 (PPK2 family)